jgi:hypothetical protein
MSVCVYSVFVLLCVNLEACDALIAVQGVLLTVYRIKKLKRYQDPTKDYRTTDR